MQVFKFSNILPKGEKTVILGAFSGFHNGHKRLIDEAKKIGKPIVLMIIEGISKLASKESEYTSLEIRLQQFANYGIDYVTLIHFDDIALLSGKDFLEKLTKQTEAVNFIGGKDLAIGKDRDLHIKDIPNSKIIPLAKISNQKISSNILKELVEIGDVELIRTLAPYYYQMKVHVSSDNKISRHSQVVPHIGIYAAWMEFDEVLYPALIHINRKKEMIIEVPDFKIKNDNYDSTISFVKMVKKIYKVDNDKITNEDKLLVNQALAQTENFII